ncbi:MAG: hypothetical protein IKS10_04895 [Lachnospiraceae bacterium]|nr:hypothetical protein [Lachnospiraceae bacterium]
MGETWKRAFCIISVSAVFLFSMVRLLELNDSSLVRGGSAYVLENKGELDTYIRGLSEYKNKKNLATQIGIKFVCPANNYDQQSLRDYYNFRTGKNISFGICWASAVLSAYRFKSPTPQIPYVYEGHEIIKNGIDRYKLNPLSITKGILHTSAVKILNDQYNAHNIPAGCVAKNSGFADIFPMIQACTATGTISLFKIPGHEMTACGYCTVRVQWKENNRIVTKFEDMALVNDTWRNITNMGVPLNNQIYSYYPERAISNGWLSDNTMWNYALGIIYDK